MGVSSSGRPSRRLDAIPLEVRLDVGLGQDDRTAGSAESDASFLNQSPEKPRSEHRVRLGRFNDREVATSTVVSSSLTL
jgi:hypothetical protein